MKKMSELIFALVIVVMSVFTAIKADALYTVPTISLTEQQLADLKEKAAHNDISATKQLASLYIRSFVFLSPCGDPGSKDDILNAAQKHIKCTTKQIAPDYTEAFKYMKPVADAGDAWAQTYIGWFYDRGKVVSQDYTAALKWYKLAADQGYPYAEDLLGRMYRDGHGVPQNHRIAAEFFQKSALQYTISNGRLAYLYFTGGPELPKDYEKAFFWQWVDSPGRPHFDEDLLAAMDGKEEPFEKKNLYSKDVSKYLTPVQIKKVQEQIKNYKMPPPTKWSPIGAVFNSQKVVPPSSNQPISQQNKP